MEPSRTFLNLPVDKQNRIIRVALREFGDKGYQGASINTMVKHLGIAKGSIYQYFKDKNALFLYVFGHCMNLVKEYLRTVRDLSRSQPLARRLKSVLSEGVRFIESHPDVYTLYVTLNQDLTIPMRQELIRAIREHSLLYVQSFLDQAETNGELKKGVDKSQARFVIDAVMDRFLLYRALPEAAHGTDIFEGGPESVNRWIDGVVTVLCGGVTLG